MTRKTLFRCLVAAYTYRDGQAWLAWIVTPRRFKYFKTQMGVLNFKMAEVLRQRSLEYFKGMFERSARVAGAFRAGTTVKFRMPFQIGEGK